MLGRTAYDTPAVTALLAAPTVLRRPPARSAMV
jgi:hypothetical protein